MHVLGPHMAAGQTVVSDRSRVAGTGQSSGAPNFSDLLSANTPEAPSAERSGSEEIARMQKELEVYKRQRDKVVQDRTIDPPAFQLALPVNDRGYMPFVTADQQKMMDRITDSYLGRPQREMEKMWEELRANGLTPEQLVRTATHFVNFDGEVVTRAEATTGGQRPAQHGSTAWTVSSL